jgi:2-keto-myo-inositol isomerase
MTVARLGFRELAGLARMLGVTGIEARNDLPQTLFDGLPAKDAGAILREAGLRLLALAEVKRFNDWSAEKARQARALMDIAAEAGAEAVSLIPRNDNQGLGNGERQANLRVALKELKPMLEDYGLTGMVEPLGFETCALRYKSEAVEAIEAVGGAGRFKLVHDTFHHTLAGGGPIFPAHTGIVHVSGMTDPNVAVSDMKDVHRVLVDAADRLGNIAQLRALRVAGYAGPVSFEAFAPETHAHPNPEAVLRASMDFIAARLAEKAA